jgi:hypothetical protein
VRVCLMIFVIGSLLSACAMFRGPSTPVYAHYDECAAQTASFTAMVACGKQNRTAYCVGRSDCGAEGTAFVQYADSLAQSVNNHEMSEAEASRRFAEFKMGLFTNIRRDRAIVAAGAAAAPPAGPTSCTRTGNTVNCY